MATLFHVLSDAERYPPTRIIGLRGTETSLCAGLSCGTASNGGGVAMTTVGGGRRAEERVSRRTLRRQVREARKQAVPIAPNPKS